MHTQPHHLFWRAFLFGCCTLTLCVSCGSPSCNSSPADTRTQQNKPRAFACATPAQEFNCTTQRAFHTLVARQKRAHFVWPSFPLSSWPTYIIEAQNKGTKKQFKGFILNHKNNKPPFDTLSTLPSQETQGLVIARYDASAQQAFEQSNGLFLLEYPLHGLYTTVMVLDETLLDEAEHGDTEWHDTFIHETFHAFQNRAWVIPKNPTLDASKLPLTTEIMAYSLLELHVLIEGLSSTQNPKKTLETFLTVRDAKERLDPSGHMRFHASQRELVEGTARYMELATRIQSPWSRSSFEPILLRAESSTHTRRDVIELFRHAFWYESGALLTLYLHNLNTPLHAHCAQGIPLAEQARRALKPPPDASAHTLLHDAKRRHNWPALQTQAETFARALDSPL